MKQLLTAITAMLLGAARGRAEQVMRTHAAARIHQDEIYSANAGGWN
jgi:hypothetical protein